MKTVEIAEYDESWPALFESLRRSVSHALGDVALAIEHVGSTSVPGLCAKPIIDIDVVVGGSTGVYVAIDRLAEIGYQHRGDLGIKDREAFKRPDGTPRHHLYVCPEESWALRNHLAIRETLRSDKELAALYGKLKIDLARRFPNDVDRYGEGKTDFLIGILRQHGFPSNEIESIQRMNRRDR